MGRVELRTTSRYMEMPRRGEQARHTNVRMGREDGEKHGRLLMAGADEPSLRIFVSGNRQNVSCNVQLGPRATQPSLRQLVYKCPCSTAAYPPPSCPSEVSPISLNPSASSATTASSPHPPPSRTSSFMHADGLPYSSMDALHQSRDDEGGECVSPATSITHT